MEKRIEIQYGALAKPLEEQLNEQGFTLGEKRDFIEKLQHSLRFCQFHLLSDSQYQSCLKKMHKKIMECAEPIEQQK